MMGMKPKIWWDGPTREIPYPTEHLRWRADKLEQKWEISTVTNGNGSQGLILATKIEWREVPTVQDDDTA